MKVATFIHYPNGRETSRNTFGATEAVVTSHKHDGRLPAAPYSGTAVIFRPGWRRRYGNEQTPLLKRITSLALDPPVV